MVQVDRQFPDGGRGNSISIPKFMAWKDNHVFQSMTLYGFGASGMNLGAGDRPEEVKTLQVSSASSRFSAWVRRWAARSLSPKTYRTARRWPC